MKKMTARQLEYRVRKGLKKHKLRLAHGFGYADMRNGAACAIGAALAFAAKTPQELVQLVNYGDDGDFSETRSRHRVARTAARILNHSLTPRDMVMLEMGYEAYVDSRHLTGKNAFAGDLVDVKPFKQNPFYKLGRKLREESLRPAKTA